MGWEYELHQAVLQKNVHQVMKLLQRSEVREALPGKSEWDWQAEEAPFHLAAFEGQTEVVRMLVDTGCDVNSYAVNGSDRETALHCAIRWRQMRLLRKRDDKEKYQLQRDDIQFKRKMQVEIVEYLMTEGADTSLKGSCSNYEDCYLRRPLMGTPLDYAKQVRNPKLVKILALEKETLPWMHEGHLCGIL